MHQSETKDTTIKKVDSAHSPKGSGGEKMLVTGNDTAMRLWEKEAPDAQKPEVVRDYETLGFVLEGKAELTIEGQTVTLTSGDSYLVPRGAKHTYHILETFSAVEATSPPAQLYGRKK